MYTGFQFFYSFYSASIGSKDEAIILLSHWSLVNNGYKCVGLGENESPNEETGNESLPEEWNTNKDVFVIRYVNEEKNKLLLKAVRDDNTLIISALVMPGELTATLQLRPENFITDHLTNFNQAFATPTAADDYDAIFKSEILNNLKPKSQNEVRKQTSVEPRHDSRPDPYSDPLRDYRAPHRDPLRTGGGYSYPTPDPFLPNVGGADLDPFRSGGGGMLLNPRSLDPSRGGYGSNFGPDGRLGQRGPPYVPPGARFDPFGPPPMGIRPSGGGGRSNFPGSNRFGNPDPDHLPPPGYDDMFN